MLIGSTRLQVTRLVVKKKRIKARGDMEYKENVDKKKMRILSCQLFKK